MKKNLRFVLMSMLMLVAGSAFADGIVINFDDDYATLFPTLAGVSSTESHDGDFNEATTSTAVQGITVTVSEKEEGNGNANRIWSGSPRLRMYSGTFTVKAAENISKIVFNANSKFNLSTTTGTLTETTWTGSASEVVFTVGGNTQLKSIEVTLGEGGENPEPQPEPTIEEITVAKALEIIAGLDNGAKTSEEYQVKGFVVGTPDFQRRDDGSLYGNVNLQIADEKGGQSTLTVYRAKDLDNQSFTEETISSLNENDEVVFQGKLQKFVKDDVVTPELTNGYLISVTPAEGPVAETVAKPVFRPNGSEFEESVEVTITCSTEGATILYAVENDASLEWKTYTEPIVLTETTTLRAKAQKGNQESEVVRATFTKKESGEEPVADGILFNFDENGQALLGLNGESSGTGESAVTDGDITEDKTATIEGVSVTVSAGVPDDNGNVRTPNRLWNSSPKLRMYSGTLTVKGQDIEKIMFEANNKFNISTTTGTLEEKTWTGLANEVVFTIGGNTQIKTITVVQKATTTAIQTVKATATDNAIYNLQGQRVVKAQKGLYIVNGKKILVK